MKENNMKVLSDKIINWAKDQGRANPQGFEINDDGCNFHYTFPKDMNQYIKKMESVISNLGLSDLRKLEDLLLHVDDEKSFTHYQVIALNSIRSLVFLEQNNRRNPQQVEPGE